MDKRPDQLPDESDSLFQLFLCDKFIGPMRLGNGAWPADDGFEAALRKLSGLRSKGHRR